MSVKIGASAFDSSGKIRAVVLAARAPLGNQKMSRYSAQALAPPYVSWTDSAGAVSLPSGVPNDAGSAPDTPSM